MRLLQNLSPRRWIAWLRPVRRRQVGALCWRQGEDGVEILLVTTRRTGRWTPPKGNEMTGKTRAAAAAEEAWEEAGVKGALSPTSIGEYHYLKWANKRRWERRAVEMFPLEVEELHDAFLETGQRERAWFPQPEAARRVNERQLRALLLAFRPPVSTPAD